MHPLQRVNEISMELIKDQEQLFHADGIRAVCKNALLPWSGQGLNLASAAACRG